jgi:NitT/TauT family transport system substrate-binding protein
LFAIAATLFWSAALLLWKAKATRPAQPSENVVLATSSFILSSLIFVAEQEGYFQREGLAVDIRITPTGMDALDMMLAGQADVATVSSPPLTQAVLDGKHPHILATIAKSDRDLVIVANAAHGIRQAEDLRGKKVAVRRGTSFEYYLDASLIDVGVPPYDVVKLDYLPQAAFDALQTGSVDAAVQTMPLAEQASRSLGNSAVLLAPPLYTMHWNVAASERFMTSHAAAAEKLMRALYEAESFMRRNPEQAMTDAARRVHVSRQDLAQHWQYYLFRVQLPQSLVVGMENEARWIAARRDNRSAFLPMPNFLEYLDIEPLRKVRPEAIRITR